VLCLLLFAATALSFLDRQVLSVLAPTLTAEFGMNNTVYSRVVFAFVLSYTIMFSVGGRLMDRLGTPLGMGLAVGVWTAASAAHAAVSGPVGLATARFFLGFGEGACFPAATKGAAEWFPLEKRALAIGIANGGSAFGAVLAPPLTACLASRYGWRGAFIATGLLGLIWLTAWTFSLRSSKLAVFMCLGPAERDEKLLRQLKPPEAGRVRGTGFLVFISVDMCYTNSPQIGLHSTGRSRW